MSFELCGSTSMPHSGHKPGIADQICCAPGKCISEFDLVTSDALVLCLQWCSGVFFRHFLSYFGILPGNSKLGGDAEHLIFLSVSK